MKKRRVTMKDIADRLGISVAAVSTALTGRRNGIFISEETRQRVWETARELGYPLERLRTRQLPLRRVALLCPPRYEMLSGAVLELSRALTQQGLLVLVYINQDLAQVSATIREILRRQAADGLIFVGSRIYTDLPPHVDLPTVVVGEVPEGSKVWQVRADNEGGGRLVGEHLWELGHRRVGFVFSEYNPLPSTRRLKGLQAIWRERGAPFPDDWVLRLASETDDEVRVKLPAFLRQGQRGLRFTALFCHNDKVAALVLKCLRGLGLRAPDDISVVGFDNAPYAEFLDPPLTTVEQPFSQLGSLAAQLLQERSIVGSTAPQERSIVGSTAPKSVVLPCRLIVRASTAPVDRSVS